MATQEAHVVPHATGGWEVVISGREESSVHATQREAHDRAREIASQGGGEVVIHARDGRIRDSQTVARDERRPRSVAR